MEATDAGSGILLDQFIIMSFGEEVESISSWAGRIMKLDEQKYLITKPLSARAKSEQAKERRAKLNASMGQLTEKGISCQNCIGVCCTFAANSMQVTPVEARDIAEHLRDVFKSGNLDQIKGILEANIKQFRLDNLISVGRGKQFRKNYTCPFYNCDLPHPSIGAPKKGCFCLATLSCMVAWHLIRSRQIKQKVATARLRPSRKSSWRRCVNLMSKLTNLCAELGSLAGTKKPYPVVELGRSFVKNRGVALGLKL